MFQPMCSVTKPIVMIPIIRGVFVLIQSKMIGLHLKQGLETKCNFYFRTAFFHSIPVSTDENLFLMQHYVNLLCSPLNLIE